MNSTVTMNSRIPDWKLFLGVQGMTIKHQKGLDKGHLTLHITCGDIRQSFSMILERRSSCGSVVRHRNSSSSSYSCNISSNSHYNNSGGGQDIVEEDAGIWKPISSSNSSVPNPLQRHSNMRIWDFSDFSGSTPVLIELEQRKVFGLKKKIIAKNIIPLRALLSLQDNDMHSEQRPVSDTDNTTDTSLCFVYPLSLHPIDDKNKTILSYPGNSNTSSSNTQSPAVATQDTASYSKDKERKIKFSGKEFMPLSTPFSNATSRASSASYSPVNPATNVPMHNDSRQVTITVSLQYRVILLQRCLQKQATAMNIQSVKHAAQETLERHQCSEFHLLAAYAPAHLFIEIMKTLAWRGVLKRALALPSDSHHLWALEYALLANNNDNVVELLQRTGKLCFPRLKPKSPNVLHWAVMGNCVTGLDILCRFLKKHGPEFLASDMGVPVNQHLSLSTLLEWRDAEDCTPLMWTCRLSIPRDNLLRVLLLSGADVTATQSKTGLNALMFACMKGHTSMVEILLSLMNNVGDLVGDDVPYTANPQASLPNNTNLTNDPVRPTPTNRYPPNDELVDMTGLASEAMPVTPTPQPPPVPVHHPTTHSDALARHLRHNVRSRQLLTGRNPLNGGFFNKLALYACQPAQRDTVSGHTALHLAIVHHAKLPVLQLLLDSGLSMLDTDRHQNNAYHLLFQSQQHVSQDNCTTTVPADTIENWERKLEYCQQLLLPLEIQRWKMYQSEWRPRMLEFLYRLQSPFLQRNVHGEHVLDILLRAILTCNPSRIHEKIPQLQIQLLKVLLVTLVEDMQLLMHHNVSPVDAMWIRVLYETFANEEKRKHLLHPSPSLSERLFAAIRVETCSQLSSFYQRDINTFDNSNLDTVAATLYHSMHTTLPFSLVAIALVQRLRILYHETSISPTEDETATPSDTVTDETLPVGETRDSFGRLVLYATGSFPDTVRTHSQKNTTAAGTNNETNDSLSSKNQKNADVLYEEHALADNAEYLFALSALSLKTMHHH